MNNNPFSITFSKEPNSLISRFDNLEEIIRSFSDENPKSESYIIAGPRGTGKTVALNLISKEFINKENWICVELNPQLDLLEQLAAQIYDKGKLKKLFLSVDFNFSFKGVGFSIQGKNPLTHISTLLAKELDYLKKKNINILITIDDVSPNQYVKIFAYEFQLFLKYEYKVFLLMTGLFHNINSLVNERSLTFLIRVPRVYLPALNLKKIADEYKRVLNVSDEEAIKFAKLTKGYAYGYQLLGSLLFESNKKVIDDALIESYDALLQERSYDMIFDELSEIERKILLLSRNKMSNSEICRLGNIKNNQLANYKKTLFKKGIISEDYRNYIDYKLPRFNEYLNYVYKYCTE